MSDRIKMSPGGQLLPEYIVEEQELDSMAAEFANKNYSGTQYVYAAYFGFIAGYKKGKIKK